MLKEVSDILITHVVMPRTANWDIYFAKWKLGRDVFALYSYARWNAPFPFGKYGWDLICPWWLSFTRRLRCKWTVEPMQDMQAFYAMDADNEIGSFMAEELRKEIDKEILESIKKYE